MIDALTDPLLIFGMCTSLTMIVLMFIADQQNNRKPDKPAKEDDTE